MPRPSIGRIAEVPSRWSLRIARLRTQKFKTKDRRSRGTLREVCRLGPGSSANGPENRRLDRCGSATSTGRIKRSRYEAQQRKAAKRRRSRLQHFASGLFSSGSASMRRANGSLIARSCSAMASESGSAAFERLGSAPCSRRTEPSRNGAKEESGRVSRPNVRSGSERSTCTGMTHVTSSLRASTSAEYRSPRFEISWDTPRS